MMSLITPTIIEPKTSQMFVFRNATDTTPTAQLLICTGIANFFFQSNGNNSTGAEVNFAIPNLTVADGQVLETTAMVAFSNLGNSFLQGTPPPIALSWSIDSVQASQNGSQVVVDASITVFGTGTVIVGLAYHVTVLLRTTP
jgi:hypothetical protein